MRVIAKRTLREFWERHASTEQSLKAWHRELENADWRNFNELKKDFPKASLVKGNRIVFNIKGNRYRLIVRLNFDQQVCWIRFIGTHAEYDKIDAARI